MRLSMSAGPHHGGPAPAPTPLASVWALLMPLCLQVCSWHSHGDGAAGPCRADPVHTSARWPRAGWSRSSCLMSHAPTCLQPPTACPALPCPAPHRGLPGFSGVVFLPTPASRCARSHKGRTCRLSDRSSLTWHCGWWRRGRRTVVSGTGKCRRWGGGSLQPGFLSCTAATSQIKVPPGGAAAAPRTLGRAEARVALAHGLQDGSLPALGLAPLPAPCHPAQPPQPTISPRASDIPRDMPTACTVSTWHHGAGGMRHVCVFPSQDVRLFTQLHLRVLDATTNQTKYWRELSVDAVGAGPGQHLGDPPGPVPRDEVPHPGAQQARWHLHGWRLGALVTGSGCRDTPLLWEDTWQLCEESVGAQGTHACTFQPRAGSAISVLVNVTQPHASFTLSFFKEPFWLHQAVLTDAPQLVQATVSQGRLSLQWLPPLEALAEQLDYQVRYAVENSHDWKVLQVPRAAKKEVLDLRPGTRYHAQVRAQPSGPWYQGSWSAWSKPVAVDAMADAGKGQGRTGGCGQRSHTARAGDREYWKWDGERRAKGDSGGGSGEGAVPAFPHRCRLDHPECYGGAAALHGSAPGAAVHLPLPLQQREAEALAPRSRPTPRTGQLPPRKQQARPGQRLLQAAAGGGRPALPAGGAARPAAGGGRVAASADCRPAAQHRHRQPVLPAHERLGAARAALSRVPRPDIN
ncbi:thrombopoietin receptor isoform X7 [Strix uralensis]|uniref:thrombopoietin receptor isoform X7 n=1 Tax=Strix uralensis TaxID=36305 RepID=UPI003DA6D3CE